ncbi:PREDICTED: tRNA-splicing endonuclease subunit Sen34 [Pseudopodoces humilis]|uniref:tRNA-splicing endonuclease subunit Sen34 n=1 Tax=Pseudopodoces humilis TaxID=181119 RepID=UPI0006B863AF|nr:PREDICTED: tRNA-splicing endonuclease subunit Sen34 [Pseudopodoces humilis]
MAAGPAGVPGVCEGEEESETPGTPPGSVAELPRVRRQRGRFLVWAPGAVRTLRERQRVWGALVGNPPRRGRAAMAAGPRLPLQLRPEEARALRESGGATVEPVDEDEEETPAERGRPSPRAERRSRVFRELWGRGLHLTPGGKFGGDFLVYPALLLCSAPPGGALACTALQWRRDLT